MLTENLLPSHYKLIKAYVLDCKTPASVLQSRKYAVRRWKKKWNERRQSLNLDRSGAYRRSGIRRESCDAVPGRCPSFQLPLVAITCTTPSTIAYYVPLCGAYGSRWPVAGLGFSVPTSTNRLLSHWFFFC